MEDHQRGDQHHHGQRGRRHDQRAINRHGAGHEQGTAQKHRAIKTQPDIGGGCRAAQQGGGQHERRRPGKARVHPAQPAFEQEYEPIDAKPGKPRCFGPQPRHPHEPAIAVIELRVGAIAKQHEHAFHRRAPGRHADEADQSVQQPHDCHRADEGAPPALAAADHMGGNGHQQRTEQIDGRRDVLGGKTQRPRGIDVGSHRDIARLHFAAHGRHVDLPGKQVRPDKRQRRAIEDERGEPDVGLGGPSHCRAVPGARHHQAQRHEYERELDRWDRRSTQHRQHDCGRAAEEG